MHAWGHAAEGAGSTCAQTAMGTGATEGGLTSPRPSGSPGIPYLLSQVRLPEIKTAWLKAPTASASFTDPTTELDLPPKPRRETDDPTWAGGPASTGPQPLLGWPRASPWRALTLLWLLDNNLFC